MKSTKFNLLALSLSVMIGLGACDKKQDDSKEIAEDQNEEKFDDTALEKDSEFAVEAADASLMEIQLGELAQTNASSDDVKAFAQQLVSDHKTASGELAALAQQKGITLPATLSEKCQKKYNDLSTKSGKDFDRAYMDLMVKDHKDAVDAFKKEAEKGEDAEIRTWASGKVATLESHLEMAKQTEDIVKKSK